MMRRVTTRSLNRLVAILMTVIMMSSSFFFAPIGVSAEENPYFAYEADSEDVVEYPVELEKEENEDKDKDLPYLQLELAVLVEPGDITLEFPVETYEDVIALLPETAEVVANYVEVPEALEIQWTFVAYAEEFDASAGAENVFKWTVDILDADLFDPLTNLYGTIIVTNFMLAPMQLSGTNGTTLSTVLYPDRPHLPGSFDLALSREAGNPYGPRPNSPVQNGRHISTIQDGEVWYDVNSFNTWGAVGFGHYTQRLFITYSWDQLHTLTGAAVRFGIFTDTGVQWPRNAFIEYSTCVVDYTTGNLMEIHNRLATEAVWHRVGPIGVDFNGNDNRTLAADRGGAPQNMIWTFNEVYNVAVFDQPIQARHVRISIERATNNAVTVNNPGVGIHCFMVFGYTDALQSDVEWFQSVYGNLQELRDNVALPTTAPGGSTLTFASSNPAVFSNTGVVNRPAIGQPSASGTLTVTATLGARSEAFVVPWTVDAAKTDAEVVAADLARIELEVGRGMLDIVLPTLGVEGSVFTWSTNGSPYLSDAGVVTRPPVGAADAVVPLTATATYNGVTSTRVFNITVAALLPAPHMVEARILNAAHGANQLIEIHWSTPHGQFDMAGNQPRTGYGFFNSGHNHPDNMVGAGGSFSFVGRTAAVFNAARANFQVLLDGAPIALTGNVDYWNLSYYRLRGTRTDQHYTTLRVASTILTPAVLARLESGESTLEVRVLGNSITAASGQIVQEQTITAIWRPYWVQQLRAPISNILVRGSEYVAWESLVEAARQMDVALSAMPAAVVADLASVATANLFGVGEHTYNNPGQRNPDANWTRAEGLGGNNFAAGSSNIWRHQYNPQPFYPETYTTLYAVDQIFIHEMFHGVHNAFNRVFGTAHPLRQEVEESYRLARSVANGGRNGWDAYVINPAGPSEYWATLPTVWFNANRNFTRCDFYILDRKGYDFFAKLLPHDLMISDAWIVEEYRLARPWGGLTADATPFGDDRLVVRPITGVGELESIAVPFGTALSAIDLPEWANVYFTNFERPDGTVLAGDAAGFTGLPVTWDLSELNLGRPGTYTLVGTIGRVNPTDVFPNPQNLTATIEIIVETPIFTLDYDIVTITDTNLTHTIAIDGTATGNITLTHNLPAGVTATLTGETIVVTGARPAHGQPPITGAFSVTAARIAATATLEVIVNLTPLPPTPPPTGFGPITPPTGQVTPPDTDDDTDVDTDTDVDQDTDQDDYATDEYLFTDVSSTDWFYTYV
ncbi:MAG: hypothetical protein FWC93_03170, partial [Defluviitaleaceae bacterium]|nr:hypothetical protein [Defluviitaleaceae bacterium]